VHPLAIVCPSSITITNQPENAIAQQKKTIELDPDFGDA